MDRPSSGWTARLFGAACALTLILTASAALAATDYTVNTLGDAGDGTCDATCTLRDAVGALSTGNDDRVVFDLSAYTAPFEIALESTLEIDASRVEVTGLVCTGCGGTNANANPAADGFTSTLAVRIVAGTTLVGSNPIILVNGSSVLLTGLNIDGGPFHGVQVAGPASSASFPTIISDSYIGTSVDGTQGLGNTGHGIFVDSAPWVTVGPGVIASGNDSDGIRFSGGGCDNLTVTGVIAGLDRTASAKLPNEDSGLNITVSTGSIAAGTVGGVTSDLGNVFSGNGLHGIYIVGEIDPGAGQSFEIISNTIGSNGVGADLGNDSNGISIEATAGQVPRELLVADNMIAANDGVGLYMLSVTDFEITGNSIGTDPTGVLALGNAFEGIYLLAGAPDHAEDNNIGGVGLENLIANNGYDGILLRRDSTNKQNRRNNVLANAIWDNGYEGIDLEAASAGDGPLLPAVGDCSGDNDYGNRGLSAPTVSVALLAGGTLTYSGAACDDMEVDLYLASGGAAENGQPKLYLGTAQGSSCGGNSISYSDCVGLFGGVVAVTPGVGVGGGAYVTAVARNAEDGDTSEAAVNLVITGTCDADGDGADDDGSVNGACSGPDCDDTDDSVYVGAPEVCDGLDNDCDLSTDEESDSDGDGESTCGADGIPGNADDDCDDSDSSVYYNAPETCDAQDEDCDTLIDEDFDGDGDGVTLCGADGDVGATADNDCDDAAATIFPGATELCNGLDEDCDGGPDANEADVDNDGEMVCAGDCDDAAPSVNTSANEVCDGIDNDCGDGIDEGYDADGDGFTTCGADGDQNITADNDCDDGNATVFPNATELCNAIDDDCDGLADETFDADGDTYPSGSACEAAGVVVDCDETNANINPGALEVCDDQIDNDCDGQLDEELDDDADTFTNCDGDCDDNDATIYPGADEGCDGLDTDCDGAIPGDETDDDGDEFNECDGEDCDDTAAAIYPGADEICDGADSDCDEVIPVDELDADGDGLMICGDGDCNDDNALIGPGLPEQCDGLDGDCDGTVPGDELDDDDDLTSECEGDCDDTTGLIGPGVTEVCDGVDEDCDEVIDNGFDLDADGVTTCGPDGDSATTADNDCNDEDVTVNPTAVETCDDGIDQDCDGLDLPCAAAADVTLGVVPPPKTGCSASVVGDGGPSAGLLMGLGLLLGVRRRRRAASFAPLLLLTLLCGCVSIDAGLVQTWWGELPEEDGGIVELEAGGSFAAGALVQQVDPLLSGGRDLLQVIIAGDLLPGTCDRQRELFEEAAAVEDAVAASKAANVADADLAGWACQELQGAAGEAFGGDGWRAVHVLVNLGDGDLSPAAGGELADVLNEGTYVAQMVDLGGRSALAPTPGDDRCVTRVLEFLATGAPIESGALLRWALAPRTHESPADDELALAGGGDPLTVGLDLPAGLSVGTVSLTTFVGDDGAETYPDAVVSTIGDPLPTQPCTELWPQRDTLAIWGGLPLEEVTR